MSETTESIYMNCWWYYCYIFRHLIGVTLDKELHPPASIGANYIYMCIDMWLHDHQIRPRR